MDSYKLVIQLNPFSSRKIENNTQREREGERLISTFCWIEGNNEEMEKKTVNKIQRGTKDGSVNGKQNGKRILYDEVSKDEKGE